MPRVESDAVSTPPPPPSSALLPLSVVGEFVSLPSSASRLSGGSGDAEDVPRTGDAIGDTMGEVAYASSRASASSTKNASPASPSFIFSFVLTPLQEICTTRSLGFMMPDIFPNRTCHGVHLMVVAGVVAAATAAAVVVVKEEDDN
jgi:hypothetical protein